MLDNSNNATAWPMEIDPDAPLWRHTVVLTGRLDDSSAPELEEEIECLYQEGVTSITVDLSRLDEVDMTGVDAVGMLGARYKRQGHGPGNDRGVARDRAGARRAGCGRSAAAGPNGGSVAGRFARRAPSAPVSRSTRTVRKSRAGLEVGRRGGAAAQPPCVGRRWCCDTLAVQAWHGSGPRGKGASVWLIEVLFIGWGTPVRGREERGLEVFNEVDRSVRSDAAGRAASRSSRSCCSNRTPTWPATSSCTAPPSS